jgi:hypothetical protein
MEDLVALGLLPHLPRIAQSLSPQEGSGSVTARRWGEVTPFRADNGTRTNNALEFNLLTSLYSEEKKRLTKGRRGKARPKDSHSPYREKVFLGS